MKDNIVPLIMLRSGNKAEIVENKNYGRGMLRRMEDIGLNIGAEVEVVTAGNPGPFLLSVKDQQIALGQGLANKILVKNILC